MHQLASLFINGHSQVVCLPEAFHFDCKEVYVCKDPNTGNIILSRTAEPWQEFINLANKSLNIPSDSMVARKVVPPQKRK